MQHSGAAYSGQLNSKLLKEHEMRTVMIQLDWALIGRLLT